MRPVLPTSVTLRTPYGHIPSPNEATKLLDVVVIDDDEIEEDEQNVVLHGGPAFVALLDDDFKIAGAAVNFGGQGVRRDTGEQQAYSMIQWLDIGNAQGQGANDQKHDDGDAAVGYPVSYQRSSGGTWRKIAAAVTFHVDAARMPQGDGVSWWIVGDDLGRAGSDKEFEKQANIDQVNGKWRVSANGIESTYERKRGHY